MGNPFNWLTRRMRRFWDSYQRHRAMETLSRLHRARPYLSPQAFLDGLPRYRGIREDVLAGLGPHLDLLQDHNIALQTVICATINRGLRKLTPLPTRSDWVVLGQALVSPGPVLLMCGSPAVALLSPWGFKRVGKHNFRDMVQDLNDPACGSKYVCTHNLAAVGWTCRNTAVRIALFNIHNPAVLLQAEGRIRRFNQPE